MRKNLTLLRRLKPSMANLRVGVSIMPGTREAQLAVEEGLVEDESELIRPTFYLAPDVKDWIVDYLKECCRRTAPVESPLGPYPGPPT